MSLSSSNFAARSFCFSITFRNSPKSGPTHNKHGCTACDATTLGIECRERSRAHTDGTAHVVIDLADHLEQLLFCRFLAHGCHNKAQSVPTNPRRPRCVVDTQEGRDAPRSVQLAATNVPSRTCRSSHTSMVPDLSLSNARNASRHPSISSWVNGIVAGRLRLVTRQNAQLVGTCGSHKHLPAAARYRTQTNL